MQRKLVSFKKVDELIDIPKKDRIELAVLGGWTCIVKKGEFEQGDLGIYYEIDSFLPDAEAYSFLGKTTTHQGKVGYRIKTMKMAGAISQGLLLPIKMFPEINMLTAREGDDLTDLLGVTKFDIDLVNDKNGQPQVTGQSKGKFPSFLQKTDQERVQNLPHYFKIHKDTLFEETLKLDGSSMTCYKVAGVDNSFLREALDFMTLGLYSKLLPVPNHYGVCSRNLELTKPKVGEKQSNFWNASDKYSIQDIPIGYAVQGEVLAPNIQANYEKVTEVEYYVFSVFHIDSQEYLKPDQAAAWVALNLPKANYVPIVDTAVKLFSECTSFEDVQKRVSGPSMNPEVKSEGRVYKALDGSCSFKCISNDYLLRKDN